MLLKFVRSTRACAKAPLFQLAPRASFSGQSPISTLDPNQSSSVPRATVAGTIQQLFGESVEVSHEDEEKFQKKILQIMKIHSGQGTNGSEQMMTFDSAVASILEYANPKNDNTEFSDVPPGYYNKYQRQIAERKRKKECKAKGIPYTRDFIAESGIKYIPRAVEVLEKITEEYISLINKFPDQANIETFRERATESPIHYLALIKFTQLIAKDVVAKHNGETVVTNKEREQQVQDQLAQFNSLKKQAESLAKNSKDQSAQNLVQLVEYYEREFKTAAVPKSIVEMDLSLPFLPLNVKEKLFPEVFPARKAYSDEEKQSVIQELNQVRHERKELRKRIIRSRNQQNTAAAQFSPKNETERLLLDIKKSGDLVVEKSLEMQGRWFVMDHLRKIGVELAIDPEDGEIDWQHVFGNSVEENIMAMEHTFQTVTALIQTQLQKVEPTFVEIEVGMDWRDEEK